MERFDENDIQVVREQHETQIRNLNFRQPRKPVLPPPQILPRWQRNQNQNQNQIDQVIPPFQENLLDEEFAQQTDDHINQFGDKESKVFLTKEEHIDAYRILRKLNQKMNIVKVIKMPWLIFKDK